MIGSGKRVLVGLSSLVLVLGAVFGTGSAWAQGQNVEPSVNTVINFPGFPNSGGPYITQVTVRPAAVSGALDTEVYIVFNEEIDGATVDGTDSTTNTDFTATGFSFGGVTVGTNWVTLDAASGAAAGDLVQLAEIGAIAGTDGSISSDLSTVPVGSGPVIIDISVTGHENDDPTDDSIRITFDEEAQFAAGGNANNTFPNTPEFFPGADPVVLEATWENDGVSDDGFYVDITQDGASTVDMNQLKTGVSKLWLEAGRFRWLAVNTPNSTEYQLPVTKQGPHVVAAYYVDGGVVGEADDALWIIMSDPVDPASLTGGFLDHFDGDADAGSWVPTDGLVASGFPGSVTTTLIVTNLAAGLTPVPVEPTDTITSYDSGGGTPLAGYQGNDAIVATVPVDVGPGIIRTSFDDQRSPTRTDDKLLIWINQSLTANAASGDFEFFGFDDTALAYVTETVGGLTRITIDGFTNDNYPVPGSRVRATGTLVSSVSGDLIADSTPMCVVDESRPYSVDLTEDIDLTYDRWDVVSSTDSVFIAWSEMGGGDDSDQSFIYFTTSPLNILDDDWMNSNLQSALPVGNLNPHTTDDLTRIGFTLIAGDLTTDGIPLVLGDQIYVILAAADFQGNVARIQDNTESAQLIGPFIFGPLCAPRDFITDASTPAEPDSAFWDHDVIHVVGDSLDGMVWHYVYGDSGAIPCESDSVVVYDGPDPLTDVRLGATIPGPGGSFPPIHIDSPDVDCVYVFNRQAAEFSSGTEILYDRGYPEILGDDSTPYPDFVFDPWNPYNLYNDSDYINIRLLANDVANDCAGTPTDARSALLHIWADFTQIDLTAGDIAGFGTPADSILFTSLGADGVDNDGDWDTFTDVDGNGDWDPGEPLNDDVGLDGVGGTNDPGEGDGLMTFGDPYVDEDGSGSYDAGETFLNVATDADGSSGRLIYDLGEPDLDSNDADEFGWYEIASNSANTRGTVLQGFPLAAPDPEAMVDPFTPIPIYVSDNGIDGAERDGAIDRSLPFVDAVPDSNRSLSHMTAHLGGDAERRFVATLDLREPTVGEITYLSTETSKTSDGGDNLMAPGSPTYNLGRWVDFTSSTNSDADVLYNRIRIRPSFGDWIDLAIDPAGDANADNFPGGMEYDEDADSTAAQANAFDEDEDGDIDEVGEGIDFSDREVHAASQDSTADDAATNGNGLHAQNDYADNDNDAFFVYDSYANGGLAGSGDVGKIYWYNIDESTTNHFDDDNDGQIDEADEVAENVGYGNGASDDNEDGIADGEAVLVPIGNAFSVLAIADPVMAEWGAPAPGPGVDAGFIRVDASHVLGQRPADGNTADTDLFYANILAYGEIVDPAFEVLTESERTFATEGYDFAGAADSAATMSFNWAETHFDGGICNLDFELIHEIYGLVADGSTEHQIRAVAIDKSGNEREVWSEPITFTIDLTSPLANIPGCDDSGDPPADFADVRPDDDGIQIYDSGKHTDSYTLTAGADDDAVEVVFEASSDPEFGTIDFTHTDMTAPFTAEWPDGGMYAMDNYPAANSDTVYFRASGVDEFGNATPEEDLCVLTVIVIDGTNPTAKITQVHDDDDLEDGACVPPDSSISIFADIDDNDGIDWVGGLDMASGAAGFDDDGDATADEDDVDGDGIYTEGVDDAGADGIPGTDDDEWNGSSVGGNFGETDDYITNDITKVVFEFNPVGDSPDLGWLQLDTIHGDPFSEGDQTIDWTSPVVATWNTIDLETGDYDIRAYACDVEGNCDSLTAFITTVCIRSEPLRAYIQPEVCQNTTMFDLYAVHYIHDYEIDRVRFEYFFDMDGDNCATDLDVGSSWTTISVDDDDTGRGDAVLYMPSPERTGESDALEDLTYGEPLGDGADANDYMYWDPDGDGYSHRDPVIDDIDDDGEFTSGVDVIVIGGDEDLVDGATLTEFADDEFYADAEGGADGLDSSDWIFRENNITGTNGTLELWMVSWDATGLEEGNYLTRAIAIDRTNQEDVIEYNCYDPASQNPEEIEAVTVDTDDPDSEFTTITLPDGTELDISDPGTQQYVAGVNEWLKICAAGSTDLARILFEYSLDGGVSWTDLDVNNDDDFYADIDDENGFQADGEDEIFNDVNGNFIYDAGVDFVRHAGDNGSVDTPDGFPLNPLVGEDPINGLDDDNDGVIDEDPTVGDPAAGEPGSPQDYESPFCVYVDVESLPLWTDVNVLFRATASDQICDNFRDDPEPAVVSVIIGENMAPEADIIRAEDQDGAEIDVFPEVMDDSGVATISSATDVMRVFVTAEDVTAIVEVDLYYRLDPNCYDDLDFDQMQWKSMTAEGWTSVDTVYPYDFDVLTGLIPDGAYQLYPRALDEGGNATDAPTNPWGFKKFGLATDEFAFVSNPVPGTDPAPTAAVGDEFLIEADLADPTQSETTAVRFYYAARILDESVDPTRVQPIAPFISDALDAEVLSEDGATDGVIVMINGEISTDFTISTSGGESQIVFDARPAADDVVTVSYNFGSWILIGDGDEFDPYSVEWSNDDGGVPAPADASLTDAYDLIATARFDLNGDWLFGGACDSDEARRSEGNHLILLDVDRPEVHIWGLAFSEEPRENQDDYPDWNTPGNPLFTCGDDINDDQDWDHAFILSGKETDVFVTAEDVGGGTIESVSLAITSENPADGSTSEMSWDMDQVGTSASTIDIPVTFYPEDYPQWAPGDIENVILYVSTDDGSSFPYKWEMTEGVDCFQVDARLFVDTDHVYEFEVDLVGDTQERVNDARNVGDLGIPRGTPTLYSAISIPETPFWYVNINSDEDLYPAGVHRAVATATDDSGNTGTNLNSDSTEDDSPQGPVVFVYDVEDPFVQDISILDDDSRPLSTDRITPALSYEVWTNVNDSPFEDFNVLRVDAVTFQYTPNQGEAWITIGHDDDTTDGWQTDWTPEDPSTDGYDNDGDGSYDEDDEKIAEYWIRTIAWDCGHNLGYSDAQDPAVLLVVTVDAAQPTTCPTTPYDGAVFGYNDAIAIAGIPSGDDLGARGASDIAEMRFQARFSNLYFVDETYNGDGHAGDFDNGIDEIWRDDNSDGEFDAGDTNVYAGADGSASTPDDSDTNIWFTLDPTPQDNSDDPWLEAANNGDEFSMVWTPSGSAFTQYGTDDGGYIDEYVRIRMVATDTAGNVDNGDDDNPPCEKLIILNDTSEDNASAYVMVVDGDWVDPVEVYTISCDSDVEVGGTVGNGGNVSHVNVYIADGADSRLIGVDNNISDDEFEILWDADAEAEGTYTIFATVVDYDDNETPHADATRITVALDCVGPSVHYKHWVNAVEYVDDNIADHSSFAIHPDTDTWDVFFYISSPDADVETIELQWRYVADPQGLWRPISELLDGTYSGFDYEPNLNEEDGGDIKHVWRFHAEDWPDNVDVDAGPMHFRALATDQAGNTNALQVLDNEQELTVDVEGPTLYDWNDDSVTNQVEVGSTTHFEITVEDDWTDVVATQLEYRNITDGGSWTFYAADEAPTGIQIDTGLGLWVSEYDWVAPSWVVHDTDYEFRLIAFDSAWNSSTNNPPHSFTLTVEDNAAPDRTKIVDVVAEVCYTTEDSGNAPDPDEPHREHDVWVDMDGSGDYSSADYLISEGENLGVDDDEADDGKATVGDDCATFPRWVGEGFLNDAAERNEVKVARTVTVVGRTWADDDGIDAGVADVTFWAWPVNADGSLDSPIMITKDEVAPNFPLYYWHVTWNTLATDVGGNRIFPDGTYKLSASAIDQEGNAEDLTSLDLTEALIVVDNVAPEATMDADPATAAIEGELTVERNEWFTLFSRVLEPGTTTEITNEDDTITWFFKRSRDLNMPDSWGMVPSAAGQTPEDGNPDVTRPYSFDVLVGELTEPTDPTNDPALAVGESYDFVMQVEDEVCNTNSHIALYADDSTIGPRHLIVHIVDTIAPHLEIVSATRALPTRDGITYGDDDAIANPTQVQAQAFETITARLLTGHRDLEYVEFVWRPMGETAWNLIDADLSSADGINWELGNWDLRALGAGNWIEVAAVGVDDIGNADQDPDIMKVYVDYEAPDFAVTSPDPESIYWCDYEHTDSGRIMDLITSVVRGTDGVHDDVYDVIFETKLSSADSTEWSEAGVATEEDLYDDTLNYYSNTIDLNELDGSNLYDLRVTLVDHAGNTNKTYQWKRVVDVDAPDYVIISNIAWEGDDTTQDPSDQGQYTDVTAGTLVEVFGTASDDEDALPNYRDPQTDEWYETAVGMLQFEVTYDIGQDGDANDGEEWRDLGVVQFDPDDLGDISAQTGSVLWNTTGLADGQYLVRVGAKDVCGNPYPGWQYSAPTNVRVVDNEPPIARIACWDADQQPHGVNPPSLVQVYALAESDPTIVDVIFQYNIVEAGETSPQGDWVNFGVADSLTDDSFTTETIWYSSIEPTDFDESVTTLWMRALAKDEQGNRYGDNPEDVVPTIQVNIVEEFDGTVTFAQVRSADMENGAEMVESVEVMIESTGNMIVTVDMATADQAPRVIMLRENNGSAIDTYPSGDNPVNYSPGVADVGLVRSLNDNTVWRGAIEIADRDHCHNYKICVTALDGEAGIAKWIDLTGAYVNEYAVTTSLGTNGVVMTQAHDSLGVYVDVHPGAVTDDGCLLVSPTWAPLVGHDQAMNITPVDNSAYHLELRSQDDYGIEFNHGYEPLVTIKFADLGDEAEGNLTVRRWNEGQTNNDGTTGAWTQSGISQIQVDGVNNTASFRIGDIGFVENGAAFGGGGDFGDYGNVFQLFTLSDSAPVLFSSVWPASPYVLDWWTDADPVITTYLRDPGGEGVDTEEIEVLIDGEYWATWLTGHGEADWIRGNGYANVDIVNAGGSVAQLTYYHSNYSRDWLADGEHTLTVRFRTTAGEWLDGTQTFYVDRTSPYIEFDGGFVANPDIINAQGYMNPAGDSLQVSLYDGGTGIMVKPDRLWFLPDFDCDGQLDPDELQFDASPYEYNPQAGGYYDDCDYPGDPDCEGCYHKVDWGMKYDLWLVDIEDDQNDIDEIEERILIHQGTADELVPWINPRLENYTPADDTLRVPVPVLGGGMIGHSDILEVTWYSEKTIERYSDGTGYDIGCGIDTVHVNGSVFYVYDSDCQYDRESQEMHIYEQGILDWAGNTGSKYVEQRFIVDMMPPDCQILSPSSTVSPTGDLDIHVVFVDDGAGINEGSIAISVVDPEGNAVDITDLNIENGVITGSVAGPLTQGEYTVNVSASDRLGNDCNTAKSVSSQTALLTMTEAYSFPNPFNPAESNGTIQFTMSKPGDVTVKIFDFGGDYVTTLLSKEPYSGGAVAVEWGGEAADGTDLANGTYIARVVVTDGAQTQETNLKVVLWRE